MQNVSVKFKQTKFYVHFAYFNFTLTQENMEWQKQHINFGNVKEQYIDGEIDMMEH